MNHVPLISVIVPVYKVEAYLDRCIQSIVDQTYRNLEIILVDDGSPDNCGAMCDAWATKDSRIKVIHQSNAGAGAARNAALDIAQGEWIGMIDSDDFIAPHMYEHLYSLTNPDIDIAECCIKKVNGDACLFDDGQSYNTVEYDVSAALHLHILNKIFLQTPPNKLYRRCTVENVRFPSGTGIDDEYWTYRAIGNARKLIHSSCIMYAYRQQAGSVMHTLNVEQRLRAVDAKIKRHAYIKERFPELTADSLKNLWFTCLYQGQVALRKDPPEAITGTITYLKTVLDAHPITMAGCSLKERIWLTMAAASFLATCRIRNRMKIGL